MRVHFLIATLVAIFLYKPALNAQEKYLEEEVNEILIEEINQIRVKENLKPLIQDEVLDAAAFDQASYIAKGGKVVHEQEKEKKKTVLGRIMFYGGLHAEAGENAAIIKLGGKEKIEPKGARINIDTDRKIVKAALASWLEEEEGRLNVMDPEFYQLGTSVVINESGEYILLAVMASMPYLLPDDRKAKLNFFGIEPYDKTICGSFLEKHPTLPQLFSDVLKIEGNTVYLTYHSLAYMEELLSGGGDGFALDILQDSQFSCETGKALFPTEINSGYLMPPVKKAQLSNYNLLKEKKEVKLELADLPDFYNKETCEMNLIIIKDGHYCETVPFNNLQSESVTWFKVPLLYAGKSDSVQMDWQDTTHIGLIRTDQWQKDIEAIIDQLQWMNYEFSSITIQQKALPIHETLEENEIVSFIKEKIHNEFLNINYTEDNSWKDFEAFKEGTIYGVETEELDDEAIQRYLLENKETDSVLSSFLDRSKRLEISFMGHVSLSKKIENEKKMKLYKWFFDQDKLQAALFMQSDLMNAVKQGNYKVKQFEKLDPHQNKKNLPFINNQIALANDMGDKVYDGNPIHIAFLELYLINKTNTEITYNRYLSQLKFWSEKSREIRNLNEWKDGFSALTNKGLNKEYIARVMLNYFLIATDYYYDKGDFDERKKAIVGIMRWHGKANLSSKEYMQLVKYLVYQDQLTNAITLLLQLEKGEQLNQKLFFYLLQIGIYDKKALPEMKYVELLRNAKEKFPKSFCKLFTKGKMGIQMLGNPEIRNMYCSHCK